MPKVMVDDIQDLVEEMFAAQPHSAFSPVMVETPQGYLVSIKRVYKNSRGEIVIEADRNA